MTKKPISKHQLISYATSYFEEKHFKKDNTRWTKITEDFTLAFFIEENNHEKDDYFIRVGIFINDIAINECWTYYGHINTDINCVSIKQIFDDTEKFFEEWTNKSLVKKRTVNYIFWKKRNPIENRRIGKFDLKNDPIPSKELYSTPEKVFNYILENY